MNRNKVFSLVIILILLGVSACSAPSVPATHTPTSTPSPTSGATSTPVIPPFEQSLITSFAQEYGLDPASIALVSSEQLDWPDGCMGVVRVGYLCAMVIVPGYRVVLDVKGLKVELHTNESGSIVLLAPLSSSELQPLWLDWISSQTPCQESQFSDQTLATGSCGQALSRSGDLSDLRKAQLLDWNRTYAGFVAETKAGMLAFYGQGNEIAPTSIQRAIAEWANVATQEIFSGPGGNSLNPVLKWSRVGGIAGFCDSLQVFATGEVSPASCKSSATPPPSTMLDAAQLDQLYSWFDAYQTTQIKQTDQATADSMTIELAFTGRGSQVMPDDVKLRVLTFASEIYASASKQK